MAPLPFDKDLDTELIRLVERNPVLYNTKHERYSTDSDSREVVWRKIGETLNRPASICKTRWINIRDNMRRKLREREKRPILNHKKYHPSYKYKYEDELSFVIPFLKGGSNEESLQDFVDEDTAVDASQFFVSEHLENQYDMHQDVTEMKPDVSSWTVVNRNDDIASSSGFKCSGAVSTSQEKATDAIEVFLEAVGSTLRNLNPYYLNQAKSKIFQVVQDCELQQIVNKGEHPSAIEK